MENNVIKDRTLSSINKTEDNRVRVVGTVKDIDPKIGTFKISDEGVEITCLPPAAGLNEVSSGDFAVISGKVLPAGENEIEIRCEHAEKIGKNDIDEYHKYLKIRNDLLNNGS